MLLLRLIDSLGGLPGGAEGQTLRYKCGLVGLLLKEPGSPLRVGGGAMYAEPR